MNEPADPITDQIIAAARDAQERFAEVSKALGGDSEEKHPGTIVADVVDRFMASVRSGHGMKCEHVTGAPSVIFGVASVPGFVGCAKCTHQHAEYKRVMDGAAGHGRACDSCGIRAAWGHTGMVQNGPLILTVSLCDPCMQTDNTTPLSEDERKGHW